MKNPGVEISGDQLEMIVRWLQTGSINLLGLPYAGKDTQGKRLSSLLQAAFISGGDILRHHKLPHDEQEILDNGYLLPSAGYLELVVPYLSLPQFSGKALILDSIGREDGEEEVVYGAAAAAGHEIKAAILLHVTEKDVRRRWQNPMDHNDRGRRADDRSGVLDRRLGEYHDKTLPVLEFYREHGLLLEVDGSGTPDEVEAVILEILYRKASSEN